MHTNPKPTSRMKRLYGLFGLLSAMIVPASSRKQKMLMRDDHAMFDTKSMLGAAGFVLGAVLTAVVAIIILAALAPIYIPAVKNLSQNVSTGDFGNSTANSLTGVFSLIISLFGLFALVGLAAVALVIHYKKGGKKVG